ncbi:GntR family transcriptional regulator [Virgibacillus sp. W0430]|uniref:GntR family transcriptional regulator n=1 Tax=Virgibacillus sp. W0430 TaxID=3391580 RepID=UPI003F480803
MELVRHQPLYEQVYEKLKQSILTGTFKFGEKINEVHIANQLNISRGPVRESIRKLEQEGLLVRDRKNQLFVYKPSVDDLIYIYQCRQALESLAVELAVEHLTDEKLKELGSIIEASNLISNEQVPTERTTAEFMRLSSDFHRAIINQSGNPRLKAQLDELKSLTHLYRAYNIQNQERRQFAHMEHEAIYQALCTKDGNKAKHLMEEHIKHDRHHLTTHFKRLFKADA